MNIFPTITIPGQYRSINPDFLALAAAELRPRIMKTLNADEPCKMPSMMTEKTVMNVARERADGSASREYAVEHTRYDPASSNRAGRLDLKERYWGSLLSCRVSS